VDEPHGVYLRRCQPSDIPKLERRVRGRRLSFLKGGDNEKYLDEHDLTGVVPLSEHQRHCKLLFGIDWDAGVGMTDAKHYWRRAGPVLWQYQLGVDWLVLRYRVLRRHGGRQVEAHHGTASVVVWMNPDHTSGPYTASTVSVVRIDVNLQNKYIKRACY
jgi:hypothetical protein